MAYTKEIYKTREWTSRAGVLLSFILGFALQFLAFYSIVNPSSAGDCYLAIILSLCGLSFFVLVVVFIIIYGINEYMGGKENG